ncbi:hypothetical protein Hbl1158_00115 [Halobaculum sp. CBA1158]|uniref:hypothetical protein n=1 Tax=Halobaculum sp. CBA1158 TaxID=2904243 RepID=UPI001F162C3F|nr:hypothetical protein [Halobaculum sp. CBA1158]UIO99820.1 hypothetical protein Hbl1158_00115 [Halobaculum sp. CBA1158]
MAAITSEDTATRERSAREVPAPDCDRIGVLLVDPNDSFRSAATALLGREAMAVEAVADAGDAPTDATRRPPDCVVIDPGVGGESAIRRAAWLGLRAPVVLATGAPPWALADAAWTVADAYVEKGRSGTFQRLEAAIRAAVDDSRRLQRAARADR